MNNEAEFWLYALILVYNNYYNNYLLIFLIAFTNLIKLLWIENVYCLLLIVVIGAKVTLILVLCDFKIEIMNKFFEAKTPGHLIFFYQEPTVDKDTGKTAISIDYVALLYKFWRVD